MLCLHYIRGCAHTNLIKTLIAKHCDLTVKESLNKAQRNEVPCLRPHSKWWNYESNSTILLMLPFIKFLFNLERIEVILSPEFKFIKIHIQFYQE